MVYVDENGNVLESVDLTKGYLIDLEWVDHPAVGQKGHFEYAELEGGGAQQTYVVDTPAQAAWREVTKQRYVLYDSSGEERLEERVAALETQLASYEGAYAEGVQDA